MRLILCADGRRLYDMEALLDKHSNPCGVPNWGQHKSKSNCSSISSSKKSPFNSEKLRGITITIYYITYSVSRAENRRMNQATTRHPGISINGYSTSLHRRSILHNSHIISNNNQLKKPIPVIFIRTSSALEDSGSWRFLAPEASVHIPSTGAGILYSGAPRSASPAQMQRLRHRSSPFP